MPTMGRRLGCSVGVMGVVEMLLSRRVARGPVRVLVTKLSVDWTLFSPGGPDGPPPRRPHACQ